MAQGLLGAPFTFTESVMFLLRDFIEFCDGFFDDVIIFSETIEEHLIHLEKVLNKLAEYGIFINFEKCQFAMNSVSFLGHNISDKGILPTVQNLQKILDFSLPKDADHLRSFLGMCSFYKKFVPDYSNLVAPLFELLRKNAKFIWSEECNKNFGLLKEKLQKSPVLISPDFKKPYIIQTDASNKSLGYVISQEVDNELRPIKFGGRVLSKSELNYDTTTKELLAIYFCVKQNEVYLMNSNFLSIMTINLW